MNTVSMADLTARARLRKVALRLFGQLGFEAASIRMIAAEAGVSPALVRHHYKSKEGLRAAVDEEVLERFGSGLADVDHARSADELMADLGAVSARTFGSDPELRAYLRRVLLEQGDASSVFFARLLREARHVVTRLAETGRLRADVDPNWAPFQLLFVTLGPLLLEQVLQPNVEVSLFDPRILLERSQASQRFIAHGLMNSE